MRKLLLSFLLVTLLVSLASCDAVGEAVENNDNRKEEKVTIPEGHLLVHYIDVGQADATLFEWSDDESSYTFLYDTGDWNKTDVMTYLEEQKIKEIDVIMISHPHADHIGQLKSILENFSVKEVWMPGTENSSQTFQEAVAAVLNDDSIGYDEPRAGDIFDIGDLTLEIIHPEKLTQSANEDSLSFIAHYGEVKFLFTGDAGIKEEAEMIARTDDLRANILQLGHHGSNTSTSAEFLQAVQPELAIYSAGIDNSYNHPHEEVITRLKEANIPFYGTDQKGTILVETDGKSYELLIDNETESEQETSTDEVNATCININTASEEELTHLIHIGEERAKEIVNNRPYESLEQLMGISGLGEGRVQDIIDQALACVN